VVSAPVWPVWPARNAPRFNGGHSVWMGCGSELISMLLPLWFAKFTRDPTGTVTTLGVVPLGRMLTVAASPGRGLAVPPPPEGVPGDPLPPPQAASPGTANAMSTSE
jgi:hypothetical protein